MLKIFRTAQRIVDGQNIIAYRSLSAPAQKENKIWQIMNMKNVSGVGVLFTGCHQVEIMMDFVAINAKQNMKNSRRRKEKREMQSWTRKEKNRKQKIG